MQVSTDSPKGKTSYKFCLSVSWVLLVFFAQIFEILRIDRIFSDWCVHNFIYFQIYKIMQIYKFVFKQKTC
jgi:hypothetical protein